MQSLADDHVHDRMPGRVELDLVAPVAEPVEGLQLRRKSMDGAAELDRLRLAEPRTIGGQAAGGVARSHGLHRVGQRAVGGEEIDIFQRGRLVQDLMGLERGQGGHRASSWLSSLPGCGENCWDVATVEPHIQIIGNRPCRRTSASSRWKGWQPGFFLWRNRSAGVKP